VSGERSSSGRTEERKVTPEQLENKIEFIIEQQAQFSSDIILLKDLQLRLTQAVADFVTDSRQRFEDTDRRIEDTDRKIEDTERKIEDTDRKIEHYRRETDRHIEELKKLIKRKITGDGDSE
jgi:chromosome segregation ATPase